MSDLSINPASNGTIHPIRNVASLSHPVGGASPSEPLTDPLRQRMAGDRVELSDTARLLNAMRQMPEVRHDRISDVRSAIARGAYDTPDRLDAALDRLLDELAEEDAMGL